MKSKEKALSGALAQACNTIRTLMVAGTQHEAMNKYKIGAKVVDLQRDVGKYGKNSVGRVAKAVGCTRALLYCHRQ